MKNALILLLLCSGLYCGAQPVKNVDAQTFKTLLNAPNTILIDLRTDEEIKTKGMIKGATQINFLDKDSETAIEKLDRKKTYLIYCAGGGRSGDCAELMQKKGFNSVVNLEKGFDDWKRKGFEIEKK
jgi:rhodanese-related sulfurtransferase